MFDAVLDAVQCGDTVIPSHNLEDKCMELTRLNEQGKSGFEEQFQVMICGCVYIQIYTHLPLYSYSHIPCLLLAITQLIYGGYI